ncbi:murein L,D-transpeptidase catalytic domain-containing protein [Flavobacterium sp. H122]|uniref:murein L,D-transpeptidase catalytic domain-containing protein n=1 Tax=Flavobacterium sp. H122 TaxID=2529860 RepID=UPI0010AB4234|nr:murein L,D-transpeptidase catalytic domain family protein [Flavobacterium sp. H122]
MKFICSLLLLMTLSCQSSTNSKDYSGYHKKALAYCKENAMNGGYYFLLDLSIHSGKNRFFIYDFKQKKVIEQNIVTHGACDHFETNVTKYQKARFSSRQDSHCSMKGKFKIGKRDYSTWGINVKYWLHGLEEQNKSAVDRVVVLHSWTRVADKEIFPRYSPLSWGCPAVSNAFMRKLDTRLQAAEKPVLLWVIE